MAAATTNGAEKDQLTLQHRPQRDDELIKVHPCSRQGSQVSAECPYMLELPTRLVLREKLNLVPCPRGDGRKTAHVLNRVMMKGSVSYCGDDFRGSPTATEFIHNQEKESKAFLAHRDLITNVGFDPYPQHSAFNKTHPVGLGIILAEQVRGHEGHKLHAKKSEAISWNNTNLGMDNNKNFRAVYVISGGPAGPQEYNQFTSDCVPAVDTYCKRIRMVSADTWAANTMNESVKIIQAAGLPKMPRGNCASVAGGVAGYGRRLIADTGASMHAVGDYTLLQGVKLYTTPIWVTLPNETRLRIAGIGRIEWENYSIPNVYLVEGFQKSLISISQLDRDHGMTGVFGQGKCEIMLADGTVVGAAILDDNDGMYVLRFLEVPE